MNKNLTRFEPLVMIAIMWAVYIVTLVTPFSFLSLGITPRSLGGLLGIFSSPFIHIGLYHILSNTIPFVVLGMLVRIDVFPVHGVGGILGTMLAGVFAATSLGIFSGFGFAEGISSMAGQIKVQFIGVVATASYTAFVTYVILKIVGVMTTGLRVSEEQEIQGLDINLHEERGYNL